MIHNSYKNICIASKNILAIMKSKDFSDKQKIELISLAQVRIEENLKDIKQIISR